MSEKLLPEHIDPYRYAEQALQLQGAVNVADMTRLGPMLSSNQGQVLVNLRFGVDEQGITFIKGRLQTVIGLQCQRCMEPYNYEIMADFILGVVKTYDEAEELPESYEPVLTQDGHLALRELVEDEVILNLPIIPKHEPSHCKVTIADEAEQTIEKAESPFRVLESLKHKQDK